MFENKLILCCLLVGNSGITIWWWCWGKADSNTQRITWSCFTETCLWAIQTHQILKAWSFRFTHSEGGMRAAREQADRAVEEREKLKQINKLNRPSGIKKKNPAVTLGGSHVRCDGGREWGKGPEHRKVRRGENECLRLIRSPWL